MLIFEYAIDHKVDLPVANIENKSIALHSPNEDSYALFWDKHDFCIAKQMNWHEIIKSALDDYFNDPDMSLFWEFKSFTSADSL